MTYPFNCGFGDHWWSATGEERTTWISNGCTNDAPPPDAPVEIEMKCARCGAFDWVAKPAPVRTRD